MRDIYDVTDDLFKTFETLRAMFRCWTKQSPDAFMNEMHKFRALEKELEQVTGDAASTQTIIRGIYRSIFPHAHSSERMN